MKKKVISKDPVTKDDLINALGNYPTKNDLKIILKNYPTKMDMEGMELRTDEKARGYRDEILTRLDGVMGELEQIRENGLFTDHDVNNLKAKVDDHEDRIKKLETSQVVTGR